MDVSVPEVLLVVGAVVLLSVVLLVGAAVVPADPEVSVIEVGAVEGEEDVSNPVV